MDKDTPNMKPKKAGRAISICKKNQIQSKKRNSRIRKYNYEYLYTLQYNVKIYKAVTDRTAERNI